MTRHALRRFLSTATISALALGGLATAAIATSIDDQVGGTARIVWFAPFNQGLETSTNGVDGGTQPIRLEVGASGDVTAVRFEYSTNGGTSWVDIGPAQDDQGAFALDWTPPAQLVPSIGLRLRAVGTVTGSTTPATAVLADVDIDQVNGTQRSVSLAPGSTLGYYQPFNTSQRLAGVRGRTNATSGAVTVGWMNGSGSLTAPTSAPLRGDRSFVGRIDLSSYPFSTTGGADQVVIGAERDTDDVEAFTLFRQEIIASDVTAVRENTTISGAPSNVTVTVTNGGSPVVGATVLPAEAGSVTGVNTPKVTDAEGKAYFDQPVSTTRYYFADADANGTFNTPPDKRDPATVSFSDPGLRFYSQYNTGNEASQSFDGTDRTIRLAVGGEPGVADVDLDYRLPNGPWTSIVRDVPRNDEGLFTYEWTPTIGPALDVTLRATGSISGTANTIEAQRSGVDIDVVDGTLATVNLTSDSKLGYFVQPYNAPNNRTLAGAHGTTSETGGTVAVSLMNDNGTPDTSTTELEPVTGVPGDTGVFDATIDLTGRPNIAGRNIALGVERDTDDIEAYTPYQQTIFDGKVTATPDRTSVATGGQAIVTVKVVDKEGRPIVGAQVYGADDGSTSPRTDDDFPAYTDARGIVVVTQPANTKVFYYANGDNNRLFNTPPDQRSSVVSITSFTPRATNLVGTSNDGRVLDFDESSPTDVFVTVTDQSGAPYEPSGNPLAGHTVEYYWMVTPTDGDPASVRVPATGTSSAPVSGSRANTPLPDSGENGTWRLFAALQPPPVFGGESLPSREVLTLEVGEATITYAAASPVQAPAGTSTLVRGSLVLPGGAGLPGRAIGLVFQRGTETNGTADASMVAADGTNTLSRNVTTDGSGQFVVTVRDPAESPQQPEKGGNIDATPAGNTDAAKADYGVDFLLSLVPGNLVIDPETALDTTGGKTPGRPVSSKVTVKTADGTTLANQAVTLTTTSGFFTPYAATFAGLTPDPAPAAGNDAGRWKSLGSTTTVQTDANGVANFTLAIERDPGFDDDGLVASTVTAAVSGVSDTEVVDWTSANPYNGGKVRLELAPNALQESGVLPKAPTSDKVVFDVFVEDQFGNLVGGETVAISDSSETATTSEPSVTTDFLRDGDFFATSTGEQDQVVTGTWTTETHKYSAATPPTPATGTETLTGTSTVNWYAVDFADSDITLEHSGDDVVPVDTSVTETYLAVDQFGEEIADLFIEFSRSGPQGEQESESGAIGQDGLIEYTYTGTSSGDAVVVATARRGNAQGALIPAAERTDTVTFTGGGENPGRDEILPRLTLKNLPDSSDRITVSARKADGAEVKLFKVVNGKRTLLKTGTLGPSGKRTWTITDARPSRKTGYQVVVRPTEDTLKGTTAVKRVT